MKTFSTRPADVRRAWHVIDATGQPLGRLSTQVATYLRGKHKPIYAPHLDTGDFVVVINAAKVRFTGNKLEQKRYYHHSGYPGGMKVRELSREIERLPERVIERAVHGMLPKGPLGLELFRHLKVYRGPTHPHEAQVNAPAPEAFVAGEPGSNAPNAQRAVAVAAVAEPAAEAPVEVGVVESEPAAAVLEAAADPGTEGPAAPRPRRRRAPRTEQRGDE
jgi:large subunit ribosomal protein L13